jgi:hypothetical protein
MDEIFINDMREAYNPKLFSDQAYHNGIYSKVLRQSPLTLENSFINYDQIYDLKSTRNLPFFHGTQEYASLLLHKDVISWYHNFHILFQTPSDIFLNYPSELKFNSNKTIYGGLSGNNYPTNVVNGDFFLNTTEPITLKVVSVDSNNIIPNTWNDVDVSEGDIFISNSNLEYGRLYAYKNSSWKDLENAKNTIIYELNSNNIPTDIFKIEKVNNTFTPISISFSENVDIDGELIYNIIRKYIITDKTSSDYLVIDEDLILEINNIPIDTSIKNYMLLPILIYILKEKVSSYTS